MLGALGGVTIAAMILSRSELKPGVVLFWLAFAGFSWLSIYGLGAPP